MSITKRSIPTGWYTDRKENLVYVFAVAPDVDTGEESVVFIEHSGERSGQTLLQSVPGFLTYVRTTGLVHRGKIPQHLLDKSPLRKGSLFDKKS